MVAGALGKYCPEFWMSKAISLVPLEDQFSSKHPSHFPSIHLRVLSYRSRSSKGSKGSSQYYYGYNGYGGPPGPSPPGPPGPSPPGPPGPSPPSPYVGGLSNTRRGYTLVVSSLEHSGMLSLAWFYNSAKSIFSHQIFLLLFPIIVQLGAGSFFAISASILPPFR